jgi:methionine--tRNA ligase beta chain
MIEFKDFEKIELRVAKVLEAELVESSDKLIKLQVSLGEEKRQILAGIKEFYSPDQLIGRQIVVVANLATRIMMGQESQGMLLAATDNGEPVLLQPSREVEPGSRIN